MNRRAFVASAGAFLAAPLARPLLSAEAQAARRAPADYTLRIQPCTLEIFSRRHRPYHRL